MTIATSVIVRSSLLLRMAMAAMSLLLLVSAALLLLMLMHADSAERLVLYRLLSLVCVAAAIRLFYRALTQANDLVIDISGTGEIRLHHTGRVAAVRVGSLSESQDDGEVVQLLKDSTLWSSMLLLRLQSANGQMFVVPVLPDSADAASFRSLSIACRWIATQGLPSGG